METHLKALATGIVHELQEFNLIGRGEEATIRIEDSGVSRQHATIRREGGHFWLVDLGSANGTYVNDAALTTARVLRDGDRIQFGTNVLLFCQDGGAPRDATEIGMATQVLRRAPVKLVTRPVTLIVADLRGFTALSAQLPADELADLLREWYSDCNTIMRQRGATIDKFIGDCVFAYWHGTEPDIRLKAVEAARALRDPEGSSSSPARLALKAQKGISLDCRIGLHVGEAAMGAMGKGINTAVGDAVNLAFRIESLTRALDVGVLASAAFVGDWPEGRALFEPRGSHEVKGHPDKIEVFSLKQS